MPFKFKPKTRKFRVFPKRKKGLKTLVKKVISSTKESKYTLDAVGATSIDNVGYITQLASIGQGDDYFQRDGNVIYLKSFEIKAQITGSDTTNIVRMMVVRSLGNDLTLSDMPSYYAFANHTKYYVYMDKHFKLQSNATPNTDYYKLFHKYIRINRRLQYTSTGGGSLAPKYYLFLISDSGVVLHPTVAWQIKTVFKDP